MNDAVIYTCFGIYVNRRLAEYRFQQLFSTRRIEDKLDADFHAGADIPSSIAIAAIRRCIGRTDL